MNFRYTLKYISAAIFALAVVSAFTFSAAAAPHDDYFTDTTQEAQDDFVAWFSQFDNADTGQCDSYDAIFSPDCIGEEGGELTSLAGVAVWLSELAEKDTEVNTQNTEDVAEEPSVTLLDQRCVNHDGTVEFGYMYVSSYEMKRDGDIYDVDDFAEGVNLNFETHSGLPDGSYLMTVFNSAGEDRVSFDVNCDEDDGEGDGDTDQLSAVCSVYPNDPSVDEPVTWGVTASGGNGEYQYSWSGAVSSSNSSATVTYVNPGLKEGYATVKSGKKFETVRCAVTVEDDEGEVMGTQRSRTIEEF